MYARFTAIKNVFISLPLSFTSEIWIRWKICYQKIFRPLKLLWLQKISIRRRNMMGREIHKAILLLRFRWTTISFLGNGSDVVTLFQCYKQLAPFFCCNIARSGSKINEMNHVKKEREMVESFIALWQSRFLSFISLAKH